MEERRKENRFSIYLKTQYRVEEGEDWKECTIMDFSQEGMGIAFPTREKVEVGSTIYLRVPQGKILVDAKGTIRWIKEDDGGLFCGIHFVWIKRERR